MCFSHQVSMAARWAPASHISSPFFRRLVSLRDETRAVTTRTSIPPASQRLTRSTMRGIGSPRPVPCCLLYVASVPSKSTPIHFSLIRSPPRYRCKDYNNNGQSYRRQYWRNEFSYLEPCNEDCGTGY